ncbi:glucosamine 6-phosphate N-acetyltransferase [Planoprotostelium fungivorum]|uniref:Glucosamine 6-phosphate N-acetyltransferase n=1 Tax=Planoprotostelium fungivorum TaxID=1890364 RepID=A0A2P6NPE1_9EUKA|nr:glucosamine 6-phosphate N-acetyltransferase [Planoprotostelium fungivorum]
MSSADITTCKFIELRVTEDNMGDPKALFSSHLLTPRRNNAQLLIRPLQIDDYDKGLLDVLSQLTQVGTVTREQFQKRFQEWKNAVDTYFIIVVEDTQTKKVIGCSSLMVERKTVHNAGKVGHIEDVAIDSGYRGKDLGAKLIFQLKHIAVQQGCYKVILSCSEKNKPFYEKSGFQQKEVQMACYFDQVKSKL